jgi:hypothetical protein
MIAGVTAPREMAIPMKVHSSGIPSTTEKPLVNGPLTLQQLLQREDFNQWNKLQEYCKYLEDNFLKTVTETGTETGTEAENLGNILDLARMQWALEFNPEQNGSEPNDKEILLEITQIHEILARKIRAEHQLDITPLPILLNMLPYYRNVIKTRNRDIPPANQSGYLCKHPGCGRCFNSKQAFKRHSRIAH